jgi:hypothetical protein
MLLGNATQRLMVPGQQRSETLAQVGIGSRCDAQLQPHGRVGSVDHVAHPCEGGVRVGLSGDLSHRGELSLVELGEGCDKEVLAGGEVAEQAALGDAGA